MLASLALRRAAIEALRPVSGETDGFWPTLAADRVFDSRIDPIDSLFGEEAKPTVVIYTETLSTESRSATNGGPFQPEIELVFEIGARRLVSMPGGDIVLEAPGSDPLLAAAIDTLTAQIMARLGLLRGDPVPVFKAARASVQKLASASYRDEEAGLKLAVSALTVTCRLASDELAAADRVLALLPSGSPGHAILAAARAALAGTAAFAVAPPTLESVAATLTRAGAQPGAPAIVTTIDTASP